MNISLLMVTSDGQGKDLPPLKLPTIIGRADDCRLRIPLASVSRHHCELYEDDDELLIRDMKSSNGTYVNKDRVTTVRELVPGDMISVGPIVFVVRIDGHPKAIDPVIAYATGSVATTSESAPTAAATSGTSPTITTTPSQHRSPATAHAAPTQNIPASKPAPAKKDEGSFESLLADLRESDFDIDLSDDDNFKPKGKK